MKPLIRYSITLIFMFLFISMNFLTKDLNEYGKWLKYYNLKHEEFKKVGADNECKIIWDDYNLMDEYIKIFKPFFIYSPDSTYFIDLDSYSLAIEKINNKLVSYGSDVDRKVQLIRKVDNKSATLLFCGSLCIPETANWITNNWVEILGFSINVSGKMIPTKWSVDLSKKTFSEYQADKYFDSLPDFYSEKERLKMIQFIKE